MSLLIDPRTIASRLPLDSYDRVLQGVLHGATASETRLFTEDDVAELLVPIG